ncbi:MAG TPA: DMT family transporter [Syntrophomonadaceae bacterium]|nr:DMT family transporter [Syntrophomonadaceae bacterium]
MNRFSKRTQAELSMLMVAFIWGATFVVVKDALRDIGPFLFLGLRFILAFLALAVLSFENIRKLRPGTWASGALLGLFLFIGYVNQTIGLKYTTASNAGFITGFSVILVPIIYCLINRCWPSFRTVVTVVTAAAGLFLLSFQGKTLSLALGDFLVLICAFGFAFHIVFVDRYSHQHNAVAITGVQILFTGVLCLSIGLVVEPWPVHFSGQALLAIAVTALLATALAFLAQNYLQKFSTPTRFAIVLTTEPVFAAVTAYFLGGEMLSRQGMAGGGLIVLSMLISILTRREKNLVEANV